MRENSGAKRRNDQKQNSENRREFHTLPLLVCFAAFFSAPIRDGCFAGTWSYMNSLEFGEASCSQEFVPMETFVEIREIRRFASPGPEPLGLAFSGATLWLASREAHRLYAVDPATGTVSEEFTTPGAPFGIAVGDDGFRVVIGFGEDDDDRYIYRFVPGEGFASNRIACPDLSGVHVALDGDALYLSQAHNRRILALDDQGAVLREIVLERRPVGMTILRGLFYLVTADDNFADLQLTELDATTETPRVTSLGSFPFVARDLTFDGSYFWTAARDSNEIVAFALPDAEAG